METNRNSVVMSSDGRGPMTRPNRPAIRQPSSGRKTMVWYMGLPSAPSCPALCRASTSYFANGKKDVDGRDKPGHDGVDFFGT